MSIIEYPFPYSVNENLVFRSVFDEFFKTIPENKRHTSTGFPIVDHYIDDSQNAVLEYALAGYLPEDLHVDVNGVNVTVWSDGATDQTVPGRRIVRKPFKSVFSDTDGIYDFDNLQADYHNGVLKITISRKQNKKPRKIDINVIK